MRNFKKINYLYIFILKCAIIYIYFLKQLRVFGPGRDLWATRDDGWCRSELLCLELGKDYGEISYYFVTLVWINQSTKAVNSYLSLSNVTIIHHYLMQRAPLLWLESHPRPETCILWQQQSQASKQISAGASVNQFNLAEALILGMVKCLLHKWILRIGGISTWTNRNR